MRSDRARMMIALGGAAMLAASPSVYRHADEMTEEERKTPPTKPVSREKTKNLPGETNRQFAARMKLEAQPHD